MRADESTDLTLREREQDGSGKERVWEDLRPRRWFSQSGQARKTRHAERAPFFLVQVRSRPRILLATKESILRSERQTLLRGRLYP